MGKYVGGFIRDLREKRGLSQSDVARLLKLKTAQSISNIERGVSPLPRTKIKRLADILGVRKGDIVNVVLHEVQDRYSKAAGVNAKPMIVSGELTADERDLLHSLAERLRVSKTQKRDLLRKQVKRIIGDRAGNA